MKRMNADKLLTAANLQIVLYTLGSLVDADGAAVTTRRAILEQDAPDDSDEAHAFILDKTTGATLTTHNLGGVFLPALEYLGLVTDVSYGERLCYTVVCPTVDPAACAAMRAKLNLRLGPYGTKLQLLHLLATRP